MTKSRVARRGPALDCEAAVAATISQITAVPKTRHPSSPVSVYLHQEEGGRRAELLL